MGISKASFKIEKFKNRLKDLRHNEEIKNYVKCLIVGLLIMSSSLTYVAYDYSYERIIESTALIEIIIGQTMMTAGTTGYKRLRKPEEKKMRIKKHDSDETSYPMTALVVDGVDATRHLEHQILESIGIRTEATNSAQEAMQLLLTGVNFDIIFVDFDLPIINGPQFVMDMRALGIPSKIVGMLTNFSDQNSQIFFEAGVNGNTQKPLTRGTVEHIIQILRFI